MKTVTMKPSDEHDFAVAIHNDDDDEGDVKLAAQLLMIMHDNAAVAVSYTHLRAHETG